MKKIARLMTLALVVFALASCEDVPSPFGTVTPPKGDSRGSDIPPTGTGTATDPFNVQKAIDFVKELGADVESETALYVKGKVLSISEISASYGNASFILSDDTEGTNKFTAYRVKGFNNQKITDEKMIKVGDDVIICGKIVNYKGNTPETVQNTGYIYSVNGKTGGDPAPTGEYGTKDAPLTVAKALEVINGLEPAGTASPAYVKGKISKVQSFNDKYKSITYYISDDGTDNNALQVYSGKGIDGADFAAQTDLEAGWTVIVTGELKKFVNSSTGAITPEFNQSSQIISIDKTTGGGGSGTPSGDPKGSGTQTDPYNVVAISQLAAKLNDKEVSTQDYYFKGKICSVKFTFSAQYGTATFNVSDDGKTGGTEFTVYSVYTFNNKPWVEGNTQIAVGDEVVIVGKITNYGGTLETASKKAYIYSLNGKTENEGGSTPGGGGDTPSTLTNGGFETWAGGIPTGWKSASTASSATLAQSTDAHTGSYSCNVKGDASANKRLASQEITLAAGTYNFSFWVKPTTSNAAQVRPGFVPIGADGKAGNYTYGEYATLTAGWQQVSYDFTLDAETTVCLVVMNPKKSSYSSGEDVLIDDATLTKK